MIRLTAGKAETAAADLHDGIRLAFIRDGQAREFRPFNGGSEARQDMRAAAALRALDLGAPAVVFRSHAVIGGPHRRGRGRRFLRLHEPGRIVLIWCDWRRAKRLLRHGRAKMASVQTVLHEED